MSYTRTSMGVNLDNKLGLKNAKSIETLVQI